MLYTAASFRMFILKAFKRNEFFDISRIFIEPENFYSRRFSRFCIGVSEFQVKIPGRGRVSWSYRGTLKESQPTFCDWLDYGS